ncbi:MAG: hypothetical protein LBV58_00585 [Acholeplasmatales bacterium]|nr:hypothetical protein [Acholeplasmatales bacterium]
MRKSLLFVIILSFIFSLYSCIDFKAVNIKSIHFVNGDYEITEFSVPEGTVLMLNIFLYPKDTTQLDYSLTSTDTNVAFIDENKKIVAKSIGVTTIRATSAERLEVYKDLVLTVFQKATGVSIRIDEDLLFVGDTFKPIVETTPIDTQQEVKYEYSKNLLFNPDDKSFTALQEGEASISVSLGEYFAITKVLINGSLKSFYGNLVSSSLRNLGINYTLTVTGSESLQAKVTNYGNVVFDDNGLTISKNVFALNLNNSLTKVIYNSSGTKAHKDIFTEDNIISSETYRKLFDLSLIKNTTNAVFKGDKNKGYLLVEDSDFLSSFTNILGINFNDSLLIYEIERLSKKVSLHLIQKAYFDILDFDLENENFYHISIDSIGETSNDGAWYFYQRGLININEISFIESSITISVGETTQLTILKIDPDTGNDFFYYDSYDSNVIEVNIDGVITGISPGTSSLRVFFGEISVYISITVI